PPFQQPDQLFQQIPLLLQRIPSIPAHDMRWRLLNAGPADIEAPMLPPIHPMPRIVKVPILMYHHVSDIPPQNVLDRSLTVSETLFRRQLDVLKAKGFQSITLNQLMAALYYQVALPPKPVILTFDDGYDDAYFSAYPLLKAHGFSGMFYIITGKVGWRGQATWSQLRDMLDHGMQMGSHTIHHVDMGSTYVTSKLQAEQEAHISQHMLQQNLHMIIQHFCYPNGGPFKGSNRSLQQAVVALLASTGYIDATTDPGPTGIIQSSQAPFALLRLRIDGRFSLPFFENTIQTDTT
ncbi:MAG: polysaccharide deacetylase family protein, partial [Ktedonobacteraceae bacterium]|nr:polysaccharide deacetylase family protein [Ktedonobacteraceae bacterium]